MTPNPDSNPIATPATSATKRAVGRPRSPINVERVRELAGLGMTAQQIADRCSISRRCLFNAMEAVPEVREAMDRGLAVAVETATRTLWHMAIEERSLGALIFWLKCRGGMTIPKQEIEVNVRQTSGAGPFIDSHVLDMAAAHSALLDSPDPDDIDGEFVEVTA